jgi:hypothetical protein
MAEHVPVISGFEPKYGGAYLICSCGKVFTREKHLVQTALAGMEDVAADFRLHAKKQAGTQESNE